MWCNPKERQGCAHFRDARWHNLEEKWCKWHNSKERWCDCKLRPSNQRAFNSKLIVYGGILQVWWVVILFYFFIFYMWLNLAWDTKLPLSERSSYHIVLEKRVFFFFFFCSNFCLGHFFFQGFQPNELPFFFWLVVNTFKGKGKVSCTFEVPRWRV